MGLIEEVEEGGGELGDGIEEEVGFGGAEAGFGGERAEDGDGGADTGAAGHLEVFWRVADVDGFAGAKAHVAKGETQRGGMRFAEAGIAAADAGGEVVPEAKITELAVDAVAVTAGDQAKIVTAGKLGEHAASAGE